MISSDITLRVATRTDADTVVVRCTHVGVNTDVRDMVDGSTRPIEVKIHGFADESADMDLLYDDTDHEVVARLDVPEPG